MSKTVRCIRCGKIVKSFLYRKEHKYCSRKCHHENVKGISFINNGSFIKGRKPWNYIGIKKKCLVCGVEFSVQGVHRKKTGKFCSYKCHGKSKKNHSPPNKGKLQLSIRGINNPNWKGGVTKKNDLIRKSLKYKKWAKTVKEKDNYICQRCSIKGGYLHSDHIKPFSLYPKLRFKLSNGRTLCKKCHYLTGWNLFRENNPRQAQLP